MPTRSCTPRRTEHLVAGAVDWFAEILLRRLVRQSGARIVQIGPTPPPAEIRPATRWIDGATWAAATVSDNAAQPGGPDRRWAWTLAAAELAVGRCDGIPLQIYTGIATHIDASSVARLLDAARSAVSWLAPSNLERQAFAELGVPAAAINVVGATPALAIAAAAARPALRRRLRLADHWPVLGILPPVTRAGGGYQALWGAYVAQQAAADLHVVVPGQEREARRMQRMASGCGGAVFTRFVGASLNLFELIALSDVLIATPLDGTRSPVLAWAAWSGRPLVLDQALTVPANASPHWSCVASEPRTIARAILHAVDSLVTQESSAACEAPPRCDDSLLGLFSDSSQPDGLAPT